MDNQKVNRKMIKIIKRSQFYPMVMDLALTVEKPDSPEAVDQLVEEFRNLCLEEMHATIVKGGEDPQAGPLTPSDLPPASLEKLLNHPNGKVYPEGYKHCVVESRTESSLTVKAPERTQAQIDAIWDSLVDQFLESWNTTNPISEHAFLKSAHEALTVDVVGKKLRDYREIAAEKVYNAWRNDPEFMRWQAGGNSIKQDEARRKVRDLSMVYLCLHVRQDLLSK